MKRTTWLQDRRMQKFRDVLSRWERKELSAMEAGELLGCSERQFRRYRRRYEEEGLAGLVDRRLGKASLRRVPVDKLVWMLGEYRTHHLGWNVKHFHEHIRQQHGFRWGYTWTKTRMPREVQRPGSSIAKYDYTVVGRVGQCPWGCPPGQRVDVNLDSLPWDAPGEGIVPESDHDQGRTAGNSGSVTTTLPSGTQVGR